MKLLTFELGIMLFLYIEESIVMFVCVVLLALPRLVTVCTSLLSSFVVCRLCTCNQEWGQFVLVCSRHLSFVYLQPRMG